MFRKAFLVVCLTVFCLGTVIGCSKPASKANASSTPPANVSSSQQAPPNVSE